MNLTCDQSDPFTLEVVLYGCKGDPAVTSVTTLIARVDSTDMAG